MEAYGDILKDISETLSKVTRLLTEDCENDPETEPYRSKYAAREMLHNIKKRLSTYVEEISGADKSKFRLTALLAYVIYLTGSISFDTEEFSTAEEELTHSSELLGGSECQPETVLVAVNLTNMLAVLWSNRQNFNTAKEFLLKAESYYVTYTSDYSVPPLDYHDLTETMSCFSEVSSDNQAKLENAYTHTLYYFAQVYLSLGERVKSAWYCHLTLKRQLHLKNLDYYDWSQNAANLSLFFTDRNAFYLGRHHLSAASFLLSQHETRLENEEHNSDDEKRLKFEKLDYSTAELTRMWVKYCIALLKFSSELFEVGGNPERQSTSDQDREDNLMQEIAELFPESSEKNRLVFHGLELSNYEDAVSCEPALNFEEARSIFLYAQKCINKAMEYFYIEDHASDNVHLVQQQSELFKLLVHFEHDADRKCRMHKRRLDMLEKILNQLNPRYFLDDCRQLMYELGETSSDMMTIKLAKLNEMGGLPSEHAVSKINMLAEQGIKYFETFLDTLKSTSTQQMPETICDELLRPSLIAYFHVARLNNKIITCDKKVKVERLQKSIDTYKKIVDYCDTHPETEDVMKDELPICREMVTLLPFKVQKIQSS